MRLTYETGIATLIQFVSISLLNVANTINSVVVTCHKNSHDCISNMIPSIIFFILISLWFCFIWLLGFAAQDRRSKYLALLLIGAELLIALIAFFNASHHPDKLSLFISLLDLALAFWVISLAIRIIRSKGGRVVTKQRARRRLKT